jgi:hypothetical protein
VGRDEGGEKFLVRSGAVDVRGVEEGQGIGTTGTSRQATVRLGRG